MKLKKKTTLLISFTLGLLLIASTALADMTNKSGYEQLKDAVKGTAESCSTGLTSFTLDTSFVIKDNGSILSSENSLSKYDRQNGTREESNNSQRMNGSSYNYYSYSDKTTDIRKGSEDDTYYVTEYTDEKDPVRFDNPFKEDEAADVERIIDALVGSLRDHVSVKENTDGSKEVYGSLNEVQIPALINALASFQTKQEFSNQRDSQNPRLTQDIYVKGIGGSAQINADGLLESILGTATLSGKDEQGTVHEITVDILVKLSDINTTKIPKPDLTGKKVVKQEGKVHASPRGPGISNPEKYIGSYKNDILIEKDGKFVKIGERHLQITQLNSTSVAGNYSEEYRQGYEKYAANKLEFSFSGKFNENSRDASIEFSEGANSPQKGNIYIDDYSAKINLHLNRPSESLQFDSLFIPVVE